MLWESSEDVTAVDRMIFWPVDVFYSLIGIVYTCNINMGLSGMIDSDNIDSNNNASQQSGYNHRPISKCNNNANTWRYSCSDVSLSDRNYSHETPKILKRRSWNGNNHCEQLRLHPNGHVHSLTLDILLCRGALAMRRWDYQMCTCTYTPNIYHMIL